MQKGDILTYDGKLYRVVSWYKIGCWSPHGFVPFSVEDFRGQGLIVSTLASSAFTPLKLNNGKR